MKVCRETERGAFKQKRVILRSTSGRWRNTTSSKILLDIISPAPFPAFDFLNKINVYIYILSVTSTTVTRGTTQSSRDHKQFDFTNTKTLHTHTLMCLHAYMLSRARVCVSVRVPCSFLIIVLFHSQSDPNRFVNIQIYIVSPIPIIYVLYNILFLHVITDRANNIITLYK